MKRLILIADSSTADRTLLSSFLSDNYEIKEASTGKEALTIFDELSYKLSAIIFNIHMPDLGTFWLIKTITADPRWHQIPIIVVAEEKDIKEEEKALRLGAMGVIEKPYHKVIVLSTIKNLMEFHEAASLANSVKRDELTGLLNRNGFIEVTTPAIEKAPANTLVLALFNVENFKLINDQYGTEVGDKLLKWIAKNISDSLLEFGNEGILGRLNSDKFAILVRKDTPNDARLLKYHAAVQNPPFLPQKVRFHVGRCLIDDPNRSVGNYIDRAFLAEETIKNEYGPISAYFDEKMMTNLLNRQRIVGEMAEALHKKEFIPYYQPQYNHEDGSIVGAEALVRWIHDGKVISPNDFVPLFEQNGFIYEMDCSIWEQVCETLRRWINKGKNPPPISVNVSRYDLLHEACQSFLLSLLDKYDLPIYLLRLEVTESAFSAGNPIFSKIEALIDAGFTVEIDDFGSGYSSLNALKDIKASSIKIDMRFFERCADEARSGTIVQFTVRLAKWLHMDVIAEGVENASQANFLKSIGCYFIQGFFYARPMSVEDFERLLHDEKLKAPLPSPSTMQLRIADLNDTGSWDSWIFKTKAGPACVLELRDGASEVIRVNDSYLTAISKVGIRVESVLKLNWSLYFDKESQLAFVSAKKRIMANENDVPTTLTFIDMPGCPSKVVIKTKQTLLAKAPDSIIVYCAVEFTSD